MVEGPKGDTKHYSDHKEMPAAKVKKERILV